MASPSRYISTPPYHHLSSYTLSYPVCFFPQVSSETIFCASQGIKDSPTHGISTALKPTHWWYLPSGGQRSVVANKPQVDFSLVSCIAVPAFSWNLFTLLSPQQVLSGIEGSGKFYVLIKLSNQLIFRYKKNILNIRIKYQVSMTTHQQELESVESCKHCKSGLIGLMD